LGDDDEIVVAPGGETGRNRQTHTEGTAEMTKILASDLRKKTASGAPKIEIEYDPAKVLDFDTRGQCATKWVETWGKKVDVEIGGEPFVLYLELFSRSLVHINENRNVLKDQ
jgi:hypothetical protein